MKTPTINPTINRKTFRCRTVAGRLIQRGMSAIDIMIYIAVVAVALSGAIILYSVYNKFKGSSEGRYVTFVLQCAMTSINANNFTSTTISTLVNKDCFGDGSNVTGKGTTGATATSKLASTAYVVAPVSLSGGTNNGLQITLGPISKRNCSGAVEALDTATSRIIVTPTGGTAVTVKPDNGNLDDDQLGLACNSADTVNIAAAASRS
jgi:hypothetical protein